MGSFKDHSSHIEKNAKQEALRKISDKRVAEAFNRCANAHNKLQENIKMFKDCVDEVIVLYQFCLKWPYSTKSIKDYTDSIESQITQMVSIYDLLKDKDGSTRAQKKNLHLQL